MHILLGLAIAAALLYFWLIGHWFARVLMLPVCAVPLSLGLGLLMAPHGGNIGMLIGVVLSWPVSGIPIYFHRWRFNQAYWLRPGVRLD
jgi:hypothetical protein